MKNIADLLVSHPFFSGISSEEISSFAGCGKNVVFSSGEVIARIGDPAETFYLLREGHIDLCLEMRAKKPYVFQTLGKGDILCVSWLIPPYRWMATAIAKETTRAIALDGLCLREKCEKDPLLGFQLLKQVVQHLVSREEALRLHLLDIYAKEEG